MAREVHGISEITPDVLTAVRGAIKQAFACGDVMPGYDAKFTGDSEEEILAQAAPHA
jgi:predicted small metal-binding protein